MNKGVINTYKTYENFKSEIYYVTNIYLSHSNVVNKCLPMPMDVGPIGRLIFLF